MDIQLDTWPLSGIRKRQPQPPSEKRCCTGALRNIHLISSDEAITLEPRSDRRPIET